MKRSKWIIATIGIVFFVLLSLGSYLVVGNMADGPDALLREANDRLQSGDYARAAELFSEAIGRDPLHMASYEGAASAYEALGEGEKAENMLALGRLRTEAMQAPADADDPAAHADIGDIGDVAQARPRNMMVIPEAAAPSGDLAEDAPDEGAGIAALSGDLPEETSGGQPEAQPEAPEETIEATPEPTPEPETYENVWVENAALEGYPPMPQLRGLQDAGTQLFINENIVAALSTAMMTKDALPAREETEEEGGEPSDAQDDATEVQYETREAWRIGKVLGLRVRWTSGGAQGDLPVYVDLRNGQLYDALELFANPLHKLKTIEAFVEPLVRAEDAGFGEGAYDRLYYAQPEIWMDADTIFFCYDAGMLDGDLHRMAVPMKDIADFAPEGSFVDALGGYSDGFTGYQEIIAAND